ncbi:MAG: murein biosynthesis integral membrane protein MurJ [Deltaproteobacteria bacterium]|nr:murein biosynthesis integral membrane protein MurJ [Candidatus Zymogenaceae bacterium]
MEHSEHSDNSRIIRAAGVVSGATFGSRVMGYIRDMVTAFFFGTGNAADAFFLAFTIPNLLRRLFAEGTLTVSFVPVFTEYYEFHGRDEARVVASVTMTALSIVLLGVVLAGIYFSPQIIAVMAPGFLEDPEKYRLTVHLTRIMFPYIFFISLSALSMGILNSLGHFLAPASAPIFLNIAMIGAMFFLCPAFQTPINGLAVGVIVGGILQLVIQLPALAQRGMIPRIRFQFSHPAVRSILRLVLPAVFGASIYQINVVVIRLLASLLPAGSISYLYYADRLTQFPLGIFAVALGTAVLPSMSKMAAKGDMDRLKTTFTDSLALTLYITVPATVGLIVLREPIMSLLFFRGEFDYVSVIKSADALLFFSLGLPAVSAVRVMSNAFYARQDTKTPVKVGALAMIINILLSLWLMTILEHSGLALAVSLASVVNGTLLLVIFRRIMGRLGLKRVLVSLVKTAVACSLMGVAVHCLSGFVLWNETGHTIIKTVVLTGAILAGGVIFALTTRALGSNEFSMLMEPLRNRLGGKK